MIWFAVAVSALLLLAAVAEYFAALHEFSVHKPLPLRVRFRHPHTWHPL